MKLYGPFSRHVRRLIFRAIRLLQTPPGSIVDVGCGQGTLLAELYEAFPRVELAGTDFSPVAVRLAADRVPDASFHVLDLTKQALPRQYDLVICSEVLEHIEDDISALKNLRRMTRRHLLVTTPQGRMRSFESGAVGHVRNYSAGELQNKMRAAGFTVAAVIEWGFPLYSPVYRDYLELTAGAGTTGAFGFVRRSLASALYWLFMLNSSRRGDELVVLAAVAGQAESDD
jgi:SAM-dependent methyltransferase